MALDTYDALKAAIADHLDRDDLTSAIPDFIRLAESRHRRDFRIREMITREPLPVNARQIALPTGCLQPIGLRLMTNPVTVLRPVSYDRMAALYEQTSGKPKHYTISNDIEFDHVPDQTYSAEILFYKQETALSDTNATNYILDKVPDAYLYGALAASAPFLMDDTRIVTFNAFYQDALQQANRVSKTRVPGPMVSKPVGSTP